jgi:uncharacterized protein YjbI with pentapeptide repeats
MPNSINFKCHCGEWRFKNAFFVVDEIREKVCRDLPFYGEIDGKQYCVLHYPHKEKVEDFNWIFQERLKEDVWDFRMVYFPKTITYKNEELNKKADFAHAIFADGVNLKYCKFNKRFDFFDSIFLEDAFFTYSSFYEQVNFNSADFRGYGYFAGTTFHPKSYPTFKQTKFKRALFAEAKFEKPDYDRKVEFSNATFSETIDFSRAKFFLKADFKDAVFPKSGRTDFESVEFHKSTSFENVTFFDADFKRAKFCYQNEIFEKTVFKNCKFDNSVSFVATKFFQNTDFSRANFQNTHFEEANFSGSANFREAKFSEDVFFNLSKFGYKDEHRISSGQANFDGAEFGKDSRVFFDNTWFSWHTSFNYVKFNGYLFFKGTAKNLVFDNIFEKDSFGGLLSFVNTTIDKPEKVYFQTVRLRPSWFVNSVFDLRKVNLIDINWGDGFKSFFTIEDELEGIEKQIKHNSKKLFAITLRQIADNAETNNRFDEASKFRKLAFETEWLEKKEKLLNSLEKLPENIEKQKGRFSEFVFRNKNYQVDNNDIPINIFGVFRKSGLILAFYRTTSFYGESWSHAFKILFFIVFVIFPLIYTQTEFQVSPKNIPLDVVVKDCKEVIDELKPSCKIENRGLYFWSEAIPQSLATAALQTVEYRIPQTFWGGIWIMLEKIFAPLQVALLALAIRRKFMR